MLQRHQVLLTDWLADHIKAAAERFDLSFSEAIRASLSINLLHYVLNSYPQHKTSLTSKKMTELLKTGKNNDLMSEDIHKFLSQIYFEARKAAEFWTEQEKKRKNTAKTAGKHG